MAYKGQKFNKYSNELKEEIMNKYLNNQGTSNSLSKEYDIPLKTVKNWVVKINKKIDISIYFLLIIIRPSKKRNHRQREELHH